MRSWAASCLGAKPLGMGDRARDGVFDKSVRKFAIWRNPGSVTHRKPDWVKDESYVRVDSLKKKKR